MIPVLEKGGQVEVRDPTTDELMGTYTVQGVRGRGGQGVVYALRDAEGAPAVVKVPSARGKLGSEIELRILKTLPPHQNLVTLAGVAAVAGITCSVLRWAHPNPYQRLNAEGMAPLTKSYRGIAAKTPLPATTVIEMVQELLAGLEHLHRYSFVHGDIKSANVLIELDTHRISVPNEGYFDLLQRRAYRTILADFGSARSLSFLRDRTKRGQRFAPDEFTPIYAPPEVFGKEPYHSGLPVDVYQVGAILYEWFTGNLPYDHVIPGLGLRGLTPDLIELKREELEGGRRLFDRQRLRAARHQDVVFAEKFASQRLRERFQEDVEAIVDASTHPDPAQRPTVPTLRREVIKLFELEPPRRGPSKGRVQLSVWNPRWHLTRDNRLAVAGRVSDDPGARERRSLARRRARQEREAELGAETEVTGASRTPTGGRAAWEPVSKRSAPPPSPPTRSTPRPPRRLEEIQDAIAVDQLRVVLVDDDRVALAVLGRSLRNRGVRLRTFQDPESALESLCRDHPHAAIVDMQMPGITGMELIQRLRRRLNGLPFPILVLSSVEEEDVLREAFRLGVVDYLVKPVTEAELLVKLQKAIKTKERGREAIPRELSGFELLEELRRSEVGVVFRVADTWDRYPDVVKALKVIRPELVGDTEPLLRLRREIDILSACEHPNLVHVREAGLEGRLLFYVADEIPADTLGHQLRERGRFDRREVRELLRELASALEYLHQYGVVMGDLSPESVGIDSRGRALLCELGSGRRMDGVLRMDESPLPRTRYTAPELFRDKPQLDYPVDLYALGVIALECWSGRPALRSRSTGLIEVDRLSEGLPTHLRELLSSLVDTRAQRRPTAHELVRMLQAALA
jgi:serine/threonine protein kinase/CheY-like chemotaxis protein